MLAKYTRPPRRRQPLPPDSTEASTELHRRHRQALEGVVGIALARPLAFVAEAAEANVNAGDFDRHPDLTAAVGAVLEVAELADPATPPRIVRDCALHVAAYRCSKLGDLENLHATTLAEIALEAGRTCDPDDPFAPYPSAAERLDWYVAEARRLANFIRAAERFADEARLAKLKMTRLLDAAANREAA